MQLSAVTQRVRLCAIIAKNYVWMVPVEIEHPTATAWIQDSFACVAIHHSHAPSALMHEKISSSNPNEN